MLIPDALVDADSDADVASDSEALVDADSDADVLADSRGLMLIQRLMCLLPDTLVLADSGLMCLLIPDAR